MNTDIIDSKQPKLLNSSEGSYIINLYLNTLNSKNTRTAYVKSIYDFFNFLYEDKALTLQMMIVDPQQTMLYGEYWKDKFLDGEIKASTFNSKIKGIKQFYDWLMVQTTKNTELVKLFNVNPFDAVKQVAENDREGSEPLSPTEIQLMFNNPIGEDEHVKERNLLMFEIAIITGIRNEALVSALISDIKQINNEWVLVVVDKENKTSYKPVNNYYERIKNWYQKDIAIHGNRKNRTIFDIHPVSANRIIKNWATKVGINKRITFHSLRTTTAVEIFHNTGDNLYRVQLMLNHSHLETSKLYVQKENKINHDGEIIIERIKQMTKFDDIIDTMSKEDLVKQLKSLDIDTKFAIMRTMSA